MLIPEKEYKHIQARLDDIERTEKVAILFAVESGSRAWGFASPDSDYDVRFIYTHPQDWYLSVQPQRDVIERALDEYLIDLSGWDIRKTLGLLLKSNPALYEWLISPITYRQNSEFRQELRELFEKYADMTVLMHHYHHIASGQINLYIEGKSEVRLKKYFYVIRPLLSLLWLRERQGFPPMDIHDLLNGITLLAEVRNAINTLLDQKKVTSELGVGLRIKTIDAWANALLNDTEWAYNEKPSDKKIAARETDMLFRRMVSATVFH